MALLERETETRAWRDYFMLAGKGSGSIAKLTNGFHAADVDSRADIFVRALSRLPDPAASSLLNNIQAIWIKERYELLKFVDESSPDPGLLRALGYHVGVTQGRSAEQRRMLLDYLMNNEALPPIKDEAYMVQWGTPRSTMRREKLLRVLGNLAEEKIYDVRFNLAVSDWLQDFNYIETT
jgi:hypothetical protein